MPLKHLKKDDLKRMLEWNMNEGISASGAESYLEHGRETSELCEAFQEDGGIDAVAQLLESFPDCSIKELRTELMEAGISESAFAAFTRAGVEAVVRDGYAVDESRLPSNKLVMTVPSKRFQENYAWLFNPDMPQPLGDREEPDETDIVPRSLTVTNEDFGIALNLSRRLIDDDQTGEFMNYSARVGRNHRIQEDIYWAGYLFASTGTNFAHSGVIVPNPSYTDPDSTTGVYVTTTNRANAITPAVLSQSAIQSLIDLADGIEDPNGKLILPIIDSMVVGNGYRWNAAHLLNSSYWPSSPNNPNQASASSTANVTGGIMGPNPLDPKQGILQGAISLFVEPHYNGAVSTPTSKFQWYMMEKQSRSLCRQERQPLEVLQESPASGQSLRQRSYYWRTYRRYAYAWFDARYVFRGSDGTV